MGLKIYFFALRYDVLLRPKRSGGVSLSEDGRQKEAQPHCHGPNAFETPVGCQVPVSPPLFDGMRSC